MNGCMHTYSSANSLSLLLLFRASNQEMVIRSFKLYLATSIKGIKTILTDIPATQPVYTVLHWDFPQIYPQPNSSTQSLIEKHTQDSTRLQSPSLRLFPQVIFDCANMIIKTDDHRIITYTSKEHRLFFIKMPKLFITKLKTTLNLWWLLHKNSRRFKVILNKSNITGYIIDLLGALFPLPKVRSSPHPEAEALLYCDYPFPPSYDCRRSSLSHLVPVTTTHGL